MAQFEPNHTHFVIVPGSDWGDESPWITWVASELAAVAGRRTARRGRRHLGPRRGAPRRRRLPGVRAWTAAGASRHARRRRPGRRRRRGDAAAPPRWCSRSRASAVPAAPAVGAGRGAARLGGALRRRARPRTSPSCSSASWASAVIGAACSAARASSTSRRMVRSTSSTTTSSTSRSWSAAISSARRSGEPARASRSAWLPVARSVSGCEQRCELSLPQVVANGLARHRGVAEDAEQVVARVERAPEWDAGRGERSAWAWRSRS